MSKSSFVRDEVQDQELKMHNLMRLFAYFKPYTKSVIFSLCITLLIVAIDIINPYILKLVIDKYIGSNDLKGLLSMALILLIMYLVSFVLLKIKIKKMTEISKQILFNIRKELYEHLYKLSFDFFDKRPVGKILARVIGDVNSLGIFFENGIISVIPDLIKILVVLILMITLNYKLALSALVMFPIALIAIAFIQVVSHKRWQIHKIKASSMNAFTFENFSGIRLVKNYTAEFKTDEIFEDLSDGYRAAFLKAIRINDLLWPVFQFSSGMGTALVYFIGVGMITDSKITIGTLIAFSTYMGMFWGPILELSKFYATMLTNLTSAERIFEIMDIEPHIQDKKDAIVLPEIKGEVEFRNVTFGYNDMHTVLENVNFKIKPGQTVALVGPTGAGKTTIAALMSRFYDVTRGEILIDGYNIKDVRLESLRKQMGIMNQDTFLFSGKVSDNIRYGKLDATDEDIVRHAKMVHAHGFIQHMPEGYATDINERGVRLSAGQRQLIAFARALISNPKILILDEATASIDTHTERLVQKGIEKLLHGRTSFIIAHRLSTIKNADLIMVVDDKGIKETGNHHELMSKKGMYYDLITTQLKFLDDTDTVTA